MYTVITATLFTTCFQGMVAFLLQFFSPCALTFLQVIIKQEPGEVSTVTSQQQPAATAAHQFVAVKGGHMISMSAQKQAGGATGATTNKVGPTRLYIPTQPDTESHGHWRGESDAYVIQIIQKLLSRF